MSMSHCHDLRLELCGRYCKVGIKEQMPVFRSQTEDVNLNDPSYNCPHTLFIWFDPISKLWFVSSQPIMDIGKGSPEWDEVAILACMDVDMETVWAPWNSEQTARLKVEFGQTHESLKAQALETKLKEVEAKLPKWQEWWHHGGSNDLVEGPPSCPPPPPKAAQPGQGLKRPRTDEAPYREAGVLPPPPPVPGSAEKPERSSGSKGDTEKVSYSWKARCVALVASFEMKLPVRMVYLVNK